MHFLPDYKAITKNRLKKFHKNNMHTVNYEIRTNLYIMISNCYAQTRKHLQRLFWFYIHGQW